jgi:hypothetical protein
VAEGRSDSSNCEASPQSQDGLWIATTYPDYNGIPEEVFQVALYTTGEFVRR